MPLSNAQTSRRNFLRYLSFAALATASAPLMSACSGDSATSSGDKNIQSLTIAAPGGPGETLNPAQAMSTATWTAMYAIYESLIVAGPQGPQFGLAKDATPNKDATSWTITLRDDAKFSDGSPVTHDDVLKSLSAMAKIPGKGAPLSDIDFAQSHHNEKEITLVLHKPRADFLSCGLGMVSLVYKNGDLDKGIGSGPYVLESGDSSQGWSLKANPHFPESLRISDTLEVQSIADHSTRLRAVESGAVDLALDLPPTAVRSIKKPAEAWIPRSWDSKCFTVVMNTTMKPFDDPEARRLIKGVIDREALINQALDGQGHAGADVIGLGFPDYPQNIHPPQATKEEAKEYFKKKNISELTLVTAEFSPGMNDGADLIAQQLKEVGIKVTVDKRDPTSYFADMEALKKLPFFCSYLLNRPLESGLPFVTGSEGLFNMSGFGANPEWDKRLQDAAAETDGDKRRALLQKLAEEIAETGGDLIWAFADEIHGRASETPDLLISQSVPVPYRFA